MEKAKKQVREAVNASIPAIVPSVVIPGKAKVGGSGAGSVSSAQSQQNAGKENKLNGKCFTADTLICTGQGYSPISELKKGDAIYSRDERTGETGLRKVEDVFCTQAHTIRQIWLDGIQKIRATAYHPFYIKEKGWVNAINLQEGDLAETLDGTAQITKIVKVRYEVPVPVYNFCVEGWESYFVSKCRVYVHNRKGTCKGSAPQQNRQHMVGENGTKVESKKMWSNKNNGKERIEVENPNPGQRPGNVHYHEPDNTKHYYDVERKIFKTEDGTVSPSSIQKLLKRNEIKDGINKGLKYLGEPHAL